ncbi:MAG TPA: protein-export chaperone SecB [Thermoanaerobaculia bacterium]|nr:protein-export chaperone SecB [Thermoanaerobaculia bacterium]
MPISQTPLDIEGYYVLTFHFGTNDSYVDEKDSTGEVAVDFAVFPHPEDSLRFQIAMSINIEHAEDRNEPYSLELELYGFFRFKPDTSKDIVNKMLFSNAAPILYGIARGYVGQATATAMHGPLMLPSYNFVALAARKLAKEREQAQQLAQGTPDAAASDAGSDVAVTND